MDERKCWNCRHWRAKDPKKWGACALTEWRDVGPVHHDSQAIARDGEAYFAILDTAPGFGCNQWAAKEE